ncbi:MAG: DNA-methyltransferase [Candidatus Hodarchaeales archaeon]|jgi:site-specific DNA-methyltransferase (adenine-specific)
MNEIMNDTIDLIVTSPPYNRSKTYSDDKGNSYNDQKPYNEYEAFLKQVWSECYRVLSPSGMFFLNVGDSANNQGYSEKMVQLAQEEGFYRLQTIIWLKSFMGRGHYTPTGRDRRLNNIFEYIYVLVKDRSKYRMNPRAIGIPYADKSNIGRYAEYDLRDAGNTWFIPYSRTTGQKLKKGHEAPFPIELPYRCLKLTGANNVLDPFMGTGSTLAAAQMLSLKGIGYEKYPRKDVIRERILEHRFNPKPINLLPHLEQTITKFATLSKFMTFGDLVRQKVFTFSKKEYNELEIILSVLDNLNEDTSLFREYINYFKVHYNKDFTSRKIKLTEFLE